MSQGTVPVAAYSRRERLRIATIQEIKDVAREFLVQDGPGNVTIRAIAREMGMTAPAVYRYFASRDELIQEIRRDIFGEMGTHLHAVIEALPDRAPASELLTAGRALRRWAIDHPHEFGLILGPWGPSEGGVLGRAEREASWRFGSLFADLIARIWHTRGFPAPDPASLDPELVGQLAALRQEYQVDLPVEALAIMVRCWVRLYGVISMDALGHLAFALPNGDAFFERELQDLATVLGIEEYYPTLQPLAG
ncbi:TetR/AcrR family transcriptional regulator [Streptomyces sp. 796.1]|uniref:TetR/AcrR family transcriptional regulator n=1 Tax=Streptomyces sp. 796.1 TaxID=3163029 RepID=UPI0039C92165